MNCPSCGASVQEGIIECPSCGVVLAKFRQRTTETRLPRPQPPPTQPAQPFANLAKPVIIGVIGAAILIGAFWFVRIRPRMGGPSLRIFGRSGGSETTLKQTTSRFRGFDLAYKLPSSPGGVASNGKEIVIGNRSDPWGLIRLEPAPGDAMKATQVPLFEPRYQQKMNVSSLTWNGENYIGYTTASWFQAEGDAFTIHDPKTLGIIGWKLGPKQLGCVAWDGSSYWAATRRNTKDSPEPALLYRLDKGFNVVSTSDAPAVGCQGLAWDGKHLWLADVFSDAIYVIDPAGDKPQLVHKEEVDQSYLSGVVVYGGEIWVTDYDNNMLQRIAPATRVAWAGGLPAPEGEPVAAASTIPFRREEAKLVARDENHFVDRKSDDTEVIDWSIELRDNALFGSWRIWYGPDLFVRGQQSSSIVTLPEFARHTFTIRSPNGKEVERQFDATAGENVMNGVRLVDATDPGEYNVSVFLHVQYIKPDGQGQILNRSGSSLTVKR